MTATSTIWKPNRPARSLTLVGLGTLGSQLAGHARGLELANITLVDHDDYELRNMLSQELTAADVGRPKVEVQAERLRSFRNTWQVQPLANRVEDLPWGRLSADVLVSCVDNRATRQWCSEITWRLGMPMIDLAVDATGWLARIEVYLPGGDGPCLTCPWDEADYALVEQEYPCQGNGGRAVPATNAPSGLSGVAAGLAALELEKMTQGRWDEVLTGRQVMLDLRHHRSFVTTLRRQAACRFDHEVWEVELLKVDLGCSNWSELLRLVGLPAGCGAVVHVEGQEFVSRLFCGPCRLSGPPLWCLERQIPPESRSCPQCGTVMQVRGINRCDRVTQAGLPAALRDAPLRAFGLRPGDLVSIATDHRDPPRHFLLDPPAGSPNCGQESTR